MVCNGRRGRAGSATRAGQGGSIAIVAALLLIALLGLGGLGLDLARLINRKAELQSLAQATAMTAASELDGTAAGIARAQARARALAESLRYAYSRASVTWSDSALSFGGTAKGDPGGVWRSGAEAAGTPARLLYARVDTGPIDGGLNAVDAVLMQLLSPRFASLRVTGRAVAGRGAMAVTPLAVCAIAPGQAASEYGYQRGVAYDLMQVKVGAAKLDTFLVDAIDPVGGAVNATTNLGWQVAAPYVCTGAMAMPQLTGGVVNVARPFPLDKLYSQLNARFGQYASGCKSANAPADRNIAPLATAAQYGDGATRQAPPAPYQPGLPLRRVLKVPLLACPVMAGSGVGNPGSIGSAKVLAIGQFFMTAPASVTSIPVEFTGLVAEDSLASLVERKE